jgi:hypothetical protein
MTRRYRQRAELGPVGVIGGGSRNHFSIGESSLTLVRILGAAAVGAGVTVEVRKHRVRPHRAAETRVLAENFREHSGR